MLKDASMQVDAQRIELPDQKFEPKRRREQMDLKFARYALAEQYQVSPEALAMEPVWDMPEICKRLLMFEITDPNHRLFRSTVCFDITSMAGAKGDTGPCDNHL